MAVAWLALFAPGQAPTAAVFSSIQSVAVLAGAVMAVTMWWIRHNTRIYQRKGPRKGRAEMAPRTDVDRLGRPLEWHLAGGAPQAQAVQHLLVQVSADGVKS